MESVDLVTLSSPVQERGYRFFSQTPSYIFTPEQFASDELLMVQTAERFSREQVLPVTERLDHQEDGLMPGLIRQAGELGFCGPDTHEDYGGLGLSKTLSARMLEFLSLNASFSVTIGVTSGISQVGLSLFGTESQKRQYLPRLASGEWIGAYALSEPNSGSDALAATTRADRRGDKWVLSGTKMWISNAKWAQFFLVMAKIDGDKFSAFLVERDFPGVSISREEHKLGLKGSSTARLILENAQVPLENLLYEEGQGHRVALNALNLGRFKLAAMSLGPAREAIGLAAGYAQERKQFGQAIAEFGLIRQKFADMAASYFVAESMIYRTGFGMDGAFSEHGGSIEGNRRAAEEFAVEASLCKVFATEAQALIVDEALQVYGGYGFTEEFPIARIYRDSRVSRIYEGTNEINRTFISDRLIRKAQAGQASLSASGDSWISELAGKAYVSWAVRAATANATERQIAIGALSDLTILTFAEQSARLRAAQNGGFYQALYDYWLAKANAQAGSAYAQVTGEPVAVPAPKAVDLDSLSEAVYHKRAPL